MNNAVFGKTMENEKEHRDVKLVTTVTRNNYLVSEPNYHRTKSFYGNLLATQSRFKCEGHNVSTKEIKDYFNSK